MPGPINSRQFQQSNFQSDRCKLRPWQATQTNRGDICNWRAAGAHSDRIESVIALERYALPADAPMSKICKAAATATLAATVTFLWAVTAGLPAAAEEQGMEQARQVCTPDVFKLCTAFIPDPNRITVCLQQNISNLSPACRVVMNGSVQQR